MALSNSFVFSITPQGREYWHNVISKHEPTLQQQIKELLTTFKPKQHEEINDDLDPWGSSMSSW